MQKFHLRDNSRRTRKESQKVLGLKQTIKNSLIFVRNHDDSKKISILKKGNRYRK